MLISRLSWFMIDIPKYSYVGTRVPHGTSFPSSSVPLLHPVIILGRIVFAIGLQVFSRRYFTFFSFRMLRQSFVVYLGCRLWQVCPSPLSGQCYPHTNRIIQKYVIHVHSQIHIIHIHVFQCLKSCLTLSAIKIV